MDIYFPPQAATQTTSNTPAPPSRKCSKVLAISLIALGIFIVLGSLFALQYHSIASIGVGSGLALIGCGAALYNPTALPQTTPPQLPPAALPQRRVSPLPSTTDVQHPPPHTSK